METQTLDKIGRSTPENEHTICSTSLKPSRSMAELNSYPTESRQKWQRKGEKYEMSHGKKTRDYVKIAQQFSKGVNMCQGVNSAERKPRTTNQIELDISRNLNQVHQKVREEMSVNAPFHPKIDSNGIPVNKLKFNESNLRIVGDIDNRTKGKV